MATLKVIPENFWRDVFHDAPCRGIMKRLSDSLAVDGVSLPLWECMTCGEKMYAGLDKDRCVVVRALAEGDRPA